ncbi:MAG: DUF115 domain-containing protein [Hyphomonadaceae bacterium]|nr:DUF115 domain-containing protein [Hyphomonadaceae bacterium]
MINNTETQNTLESEKSRLVERLPTRSPIYLPTEKIPLEDQIEGLKRVEKLYTTELNQIYKPRIRALKKHFSGRKKRCFIIGNGPSLKKTDLTLLDNEITFAVNGFFLKSGDVNWKPTFYLVEDHLVAEDRAEQIKDFKGPIKFFPAYLAYCIEQDDECIFYNHRPRISYPHGFDFSTQADEITYTGCTVVFSAMQIAAYLGFEEIYLIGVDADYEIPADTKVSKSYGTSVLDMKSDDTNHFHPDYFGKGNRWHDPQVDKMLEAYKEAKKVTESINVKIFNATVGGKLDVFERRNYEDLFSDPKNFADSQKPKTLLLDFNKTGGASATGSLTAKYFEDWQKDRFLQICVPGTNQYEVFDRFDDNGPTPKSNVEEAINKFNPDIILYRPVAEHPHFHEFAMQTLSKLGVPYAVWLMDDWPSRLILHNPEYGEKIDNDLKQLCQNAAACLSISDAMSGAFGSRYGAQFKKFHNGVSPKKWSKIKRKQARKSDCTIRYAGGLAADMSIDSVRDIAQAVSHLNSVGQNVRFEIMTQKHWFSKYHYEFAELDGVEISVSTLSNKAYREWLSQADLLLITYNFDDDTKCYVKYSFANKLPECCASGTPIIAYGPDGLATLDTLEELNLAFRIKTRDPNELSDALTKLTNSPSKRLQLGKMAQSFAFSRFSIENYKMDFLRELVLASETIPKSFEYRRQVGSPEKVASVANTNYTLLSFFKKYTLSWKGVVGVFSAVLLAIALTMITITDSIVVKAGAIFMVFLAQLLLFLLIAHLAAHLNKTVAVLENRRNK